MRADRSWVLAVALAAMAAVASGLAPASATLIIALLAFVAASVLRPGFALGSVVASALIMSGMQSAIALPSQAGLLTRAFIAVFALSTMLRLRRGARVHARLTAVIVWAALLLASSAVGVSDRLLALQGMWTYLCGPAVFLAILYSDLSERTLQRVSLLAVAIVVAELPIVLYQNAFVATAVDQIGGTFGTIGGTSIQAVVMGFAWTVAIGLLAGRRRIWLVPIALAIGTVLLVSEAKAGFLFCAIGTTVVGLTTGVLTRRLATFSIRYLAVAAGSVAALYGGYIYAGSILRGGERGAINLLRSMSSQGAIVRYLFSHGPQGQAGRLEGARLALTAGRSTIVDNLLGKGPGLLSSSTLFGGRSAFLTATGATFEWATSLTRSLLETGILGTLLYAASIVSAAWTAADSWKESGAVGQRVAAVCAGLAAVYVVSGVYASAWHTDAVAVVFWCAMGIAARWGQRRRQAEGATSVENDVADTHALAS